MNAPAPALAAARAFVNGCAARGITASVAAVPGDGQAEAVGELWADVARASVAAYIRANGSDPVDAAAIITEAVVPELKRIRDEVAELAGERGKLALQLALVHSILLDDNVSAEDARGRAVAAAFSDAPAPAVPCSAREDEAAASPRGVPGPASPQLREAVLGQVREAAGCASADGDDCEKCGGHADAILAAVAAAADGGAP